MGDKDEKRNLRRRNADSENAVPAKRVTRATSFCGERGKFFCLLLYE